MDNMTTSMVFDASTLQPIDKPEPVEFESEPNEEYYVNEDIGNYSTINSNANIGFTRHQNLILGWLLLFGGILSFLGGSYICYWAWKRRDHVYHRLMLAVSIYVLLWSPWMMYGSAALPIESPDYPWASGNFRTCTAQGFFAQLSTAIPAYYVSLSCFSWIVVVYGNFDPSKYAWVEKYIHIGVNLWVLASASALVYLEAFNQTKGWPSCWIGAVPQGCGKASGIPCTRGPQNHEQIRSFFLGGLSLAFLVIPALVMAALACFLYRRQKLGKGPRVLRNSDTTYTWAVTKQSLVYIGTLWFCYIPTLLISMFDEFFKGLFVVYCIGSLASVSVGFWFALVYRYFSSTSECGITIDFRNLRRGSKSLGDSTKQQTVINRTRRMLSLSGSGHGMSDRTPPKDGSRKEECRTDSSKDDEPTTTNQQHPPRSERDDSQVSFTFNIFDGTAPSNSQFADFIFDGNDSDDDYDEEETRYWAGCQNVN